METSIFLAKVIGLVLVISSTAVLVRYRTSLALEGEAVKSPATAYLAGFGILILGAMLVVSHSVWTADWRIVVTVMGWLVLLKGVGRIFFPEAVSRMLAKKPADRRFMLGECVTLLVGLYLVYHGFIAP